MLDPASDLVPPPSSPTISTISSSDLESASTGSFFHDRSTTLGTLMGVTFPASFAFHAPSQRRRADGHVAEDEMDDDEDYRNRRRLPKQRRWWRGLCRDDVSGAIVGNSRRRNSASLGEFLEVERRFGEAPLYTGGGDQLEGIVSATRDGERVLFEEGRVLPPARKRVMHDSISNGAGAVRFRASITGLCNRAVE
ncbi:hypothetical protein V2J09_022161 [Rumex salicifolius]